MSPLPKLNNNYCPSGRSTAATGNQLKDGTGDSCPQKDPIPKSCSGGEMKDQVHKLFFSFSITCHYMKALTQKMAIQAWKKSNIEKKKELGRENSLFSVKLG